MDTCRASLNRQLANCIIQIRRPHVSLLLMQAMSQYHLLLLYPSRMQCLNRVSGLLTQELTLSLGRSSSGFNAAAPVPTGALVSGTPSGLQADDSDGMLYLYTGKPRSSHTGAGCKRAKQIHIHRSAGSSNLAQHLGKHLKLEYVEHCIVEHDAVDTTKLCSLPVGMLCGLGLLSFGAPSLKSMVSLWLSVHALQEMGFMR